jgi:AcrR family transcriptional regulator
MRLFGEKGYKGASITRIEAASGLSPGAGGLYRHFRSKEELLAAGVQRHLGRLDALREVREVLNDFGDLQEQLAITARYFLAELDSQTELLRFLVPEPKQSPQLLSKAVDAAHRRHVPRVCRLASSGSRRHCLFAALAQRHRSEVPFD